MKKTKRQLSKKKKQQRHEALVEQFLDIFNVQASHADVAAAFCEAMYLLDRDDK